MFFFDDDSTTSSDNSFWGDAHQTCIDLTEPVGDATNWMYDTIAEKGLPAPIAEQVGDFVGGFVEDNWHNVCDLPENIAHSFDNPSSDAPVSN